MSEIYLSMTVGINEWAKPVIEEVHKIIKKHEGKHLVGEDYNQLMDEVIKGIVQHAVYVQGNHKGIQIPRHNNNIEIPPEGVAIKEPIEVKTTTEIIKLYGDKECPLDLSDWTTGPTKTLGGGTVTSVSSSNTVVKSSDGGSVSTSPYPGTVTSMS